MGRRSSAVDRVLSFFFTTSFLYEKNSNDLPKGEIIKSILDSAGTRSPIYLPHITGDTALSKNYSVIDMTWENGARQSSADRRSEIKDGKRLKKWRCKACP